jgi:hypothetical protein
MAARNRKGDGTSRILDKAKQSIEEGKYYEAHQMYRTVYYRFVSQRRNEEALNLVYTGASLLLTHEQFGSGLDLSLLIIERLNTDKIPVSDDRLGSWCTIHLYYSLVLFSVASFLMQPQIRLHNCLVFLMTERGLELSSFEQLSSGVLVGIRLINMATQGCIN